MTPTCCQKCSRKVDRSACENYKRCARWREWFHEEWKNMRRNAALIKLKREEKENKK